MPIANNFLRRLLQLPFDGIQYPPAHPGSRIVAVPHQRGEGTGVTLRGESGQHDGGPFLIPQDFLQPVDEGRVGGAGGRNDRRVLNDISIRRRAEPRKYLRARPDGIDARERDQGIGPNLVTRVPLPGRQRRLLRP